MSMTAASYVDLQRIRLRFTENQPAFTENQPAFTRSHAESVGMRGRLAKSFDEVGVQADP